MTIESNVIAAAETAASPYRLYAEIAGVIALLGISIAWWVGHNHKEQTIGAQQCIEKTTITKQEATIDVDKINADHAQQLSAVVQSFQAKLAAEHANNASLAKRLLDHDTAIRPGAMPIVSGPSGAVCRAAVDAAVGRIEAEHAPSFEACLVNQDEINALRAAWIEQAKKKGP